MGEFNFEDALKAIELMQTCLAQKGWTINSYGYDPPVEDELKFILSPWETDDNELMEIEDGPNPFALAEI